MNNQFLSIPPEMRELPQWCITRGTALDKKPRMLDGQLASSVDPATWTDFESACRVAAERGWMIGFIFAETDPFTCIDLDWVNEQTQLAKGQVVDRAKWTTEADGQAYQRIVEHMNSYAEVSRSGVGLHVIVRADIGAGCKVGNVEVYSQKRFLICTGNVWRDWPILDQQVSVDALVNELRLRQGIHNVNIDPIADAPENENDAAVIARAQRAANAEKFTQLTLGQWRDMGYASQSEADMALLSMLAFYSPNNAQVMRLFRQTALGKREKAVKDDKYLSRSVDFIRRSQALDKARTDAQREAFKAMGYGEDDAQSALPPTMDIKEMHNALVDIVAEKQVIVFRDNPVVQLSPQIMGSLLGHNKMSIVDANGKEVEAPTFSIWRGSEKRMTAYALNFDPSAGEFFQSEDGRKAFNLYRPRPHTAPADWQQRVTMFLEHVAFLVPDDTERYRLLDWLAHIEQHPGVLPHNHYLMIATQQGVGRGWLTAVLAHVWSGHVAMDFDLKASLANGFNGQLSRKFLAVVDEINEGGTGEQWRHSEKLKSMVTASYRFINVKYGLQHTEKNCCRWLLCSNYETALPLTADDRRWNVIRNPNEPRDADYYSRLYAPLYPRPDALFIASVREFLRTRNIAAFNPGAHAARNDAKQAVIANSLSKEDEDVEELVAARMQDVILSDELFKAIFKVNPEFAADAGRKWNQLGHIARRAGMEPMPKPLAILGRKKAKVWIVRNPQRWREATPLAVEQELNRVG